MPVERNTDSLASAPAQVLTLDLKSQRKESLSEAFVRASDND